MSSDLTQPPLTSDVTIPSQDVDAHVEHVDHVVNKHVVNVAIGEIIGDDPTATSLEGTWIGDAQAVPLLELEQAGTKMDEDIEVSQMASPCGDAGNNMSSALPESYMGVSAERDVSAEMGVSEPACKRKRESSSPASILTD